MTKEEFLAIAATKYDEVKQLKKHNNFYDYEVGFERVMNEMSRELLEKSLGDLPTDRRKKKKW